MKSSNYAITPAAKISALAPLIARFLFSLIFFWTGHRLFDGNAMVAYGQMATGAGMPLGSILAPIGAFIAPVGALSILIGYRIRIGAFLIIAFLVPVTVVMHKFWNVGPQGSFSIVQMQNFMKNGGLIAGAMMFAYHGAGPFSIDAWLSHKRGTAL